MRIVSTNGLKWFMRACLAAAMCPTVGAQEVKSKMRIDCLTLQMIEQKPAPEIKEKPAPDVIVETADDIHIRFVLKNNCDQTIYYLAYNLRNYNTAPAGYMIYRGENNQWTARSPGWRRDGEFTGVTFHWLPIKTGRSIEFEYSDLSLIKGERSVAIYLNTTPSHENRAEVIGKPFTLKKP